MKSLIKHNSRELAQLQPWNSQQMLNIIKKLKVTPKELHDAIIETGSLDFNQVKSHLKKKTHSFSFWRTLFPMGPSKLNY